MNYFQKFNMAVGYDINLEHLKQSYLDLQKIYHPDKAKDEKQKLEFLEESSYINKAYNALIDDIARAEYLLELKNINFAEQKPSQDLLIYAMELQEEISNLNAEEDIQVFVKRILVRRKELLLKIKYNFQERDMKLVIENLLELKYINKAFNDAMNKINIV